ncbi:hypothetical protein QC762_0092060 [Podospora pseudocomata]|uniref:Uncharacterized protein n=1 Tax=Podospora pseudocomata TaxID=2093779 RepID=A0ABR0G6I7_9PEZI|nr:hypothetical protein QC762_0092060 [Podospora pseudocomata]
MALLPDEFFYCDRSQLGMMMSRLPNSETILIRGERAKAKTADLRTLQKIPSPFSYSSGGLVI